MNSLVYDENINTEDLNYWAKRVEGCEETMDIIREYEDIIKASKKKHIFCISTR